MKGFNILFLDDDPQRTSAFTDRHTEAKTAETANGIIKLIRDQEEDITILHLDHDLGGLIFVDSDEKNTGMEVVRWLVEHRDEYVDKIGAIVVHTLNPPAGRTMLSKLHQAGYEAKYIPWTSILQYWRELDNAMFSNPGVDDR